MNGEVNEIDTSAILISLKIKGETKDATVVECFHQKYIKVELDDDGVDHHFQLKWNGFMYEGKFLEMSMTSPYNVDRDFSVAKVKVEDKVAEPVKLQRKHSGYPVAFR